MINLEVLESMQQAGYNVTACGNCGEVKLHKTGVTELTCEYCDFTSDISDFPDIEV